MSKSSSMAKYFPGSPSADGPRMSIRDKIMIKRRSTVRSTQSAAEVSSTTMVTEAESSEEEANEEPKCGIVLDIISRTGEGAGRSTQQVMDDLKGGDKDTYAYGKDAILRDEFMSLVWNDVTKFYKNAQCLRDAGADKKVWPRTTCTQIRNLVRSILSYKREVVCFRAEVYNWRFKEKLLHTHVKPKLETMTERFDRLENFWTQFHKNHRRNELPPVDTSMRSTMNSTMGSTMGSTTGFSMTATSSGWRKKMPSHKEERKPMCFADELQWSMIERIEERSKPNHKRRERAPSCVSYNPKYSAISGVGMKKKSQPASGGGRRTSVSDGMFGEPPPLQQSRRIPSMSSTATAGFGLSKSASEPGISMTSNCLKEYVKGSSLPPIGTVLSSKNKAEPLPSIGRSGQEVEATPLDSYLEACQRCWIVPTPLPFVTGHSWRLQARGKNMMDNDLRAVAPMLQDVSSIEEIDLSGNGLLTEKALVPFLERLFGEPATSTLQRLALQGLKHLGNQSIHVITQLLFEVDGLRNLRSIDMSHVHITPKSHLKLAKAINDHPTIETVNLSDSALGSNSWIARQCVSLLVSDNVTSLDIGWNCLGAEVFQQLGESLVARRRIKKLSVSNCSSACIDFNIPSPISFFLEYLSQDVALTSLDVSLNRMDFRAMLILEDSFEKHKKIQSINLGNNPLGVLGMRSALRLLCMSHNSLQAFDSTHCFRGTESSAAQTFNMTNPGGKYTLELARPYHRSVLRMLYKVCERFQQPPEQAFRDVKYSRSGWSHASKGVHGLFEVPKEGTLNFMFSIESTIENSITGIADDDFGGFIEKHSILTKLQPCFKKIIPLFACWKGLDGNVMDQTALLNALSKDFCLTPSHLEHMCESCPSMRAETIYRLLPCVLGGEASESLCMLLFPSFGEFVRMHKCMRAFIDFNVENPTGHYKLDLGNCTDYAVAEKLLLLDRWEVVLDRRNKRSDVSQYGNRSHIRNEHYRHQPLHLEYTTIAEWTLPEVDVFECDYATGRRCPHGAVVIGESTFESMLVSLYEAECSQKAKLQVLQLVSHHLWLSALMMRELLGTFKLEADRAEAFVTFFLRVKDMWNAKVFRVRFVDHDEVKRLQDRLGYATFFPFIQPENAQFQLDCQFWDQRLCVNMLLQLCSKEGTPNLRKPQYQYPDGTYDPLTLGVPKSWETFEKMPQSGIFKAEYACAPENRKFSTRKMLAECYGHFDMHIEESEVMWWTGLSEVTEDVLEWLEFCIGKFATMDDAFTEFDGPGGNGVITLREFEEGINDVGCKKFRGKDETSRIQALFRYLDPGGEGTVSREEWAILEQLRKEYILCITEFVQFLQRTFGNDLAVAWDFLDSDNSEELSLEEWLHSCQAIGYFGPARCVFGLLDNSDDGKISLQEFIVLEDYKKGR